MGPRRAEFDEIGITGYPESHHLISDEETIQAMFAKAPMATCIVSQICFDAAVIADWIREVRARGTDLPIWIGLPGSVDRAQLLRISMKIGLGESARFLRHHRNWMSRLLTRRSSPTAWSATSTPVATDPAAHVAGFHLYTFNEVARTERWRRRTLERLGGLARSRRPEFRPGGQKSGRLRLGRSSSDSTSSVETSTTRISSPRAFTPSSSITVQNGQATASVPAPVSAASRARSSLIRPPRSSIHMCAPPAPQQNVRLPLLLHLDRRADGGDELARVGAHVVVAGQVAGVVVGDRCGRRCRAQSRPSRTSSASSSRVVDDLVARRRSPGTRCRAC